MSRKAHLFIHYNSELHVYTMYGTVLDTELPLLCVCEHYHHMGKIQHTHIDNAFT
jgi:hypothetical protein